MENARERFTFRKAEKLCHKKLIEQLFSEGRSLYVRPIKILALKTVPDPAAPIKVLISVPKKYIRHAVDRNRIKRLLREAYRKNKRILISCLPEQNEGRLLAFVYTSREISDYKLIEACIIQGLENLALTLQKADAAGTEPLLPSPLV